MSHVSYPFLGSNLGGANTAFAADTTATRELGTRVQANDGKVFRYCIAGDTVSAGDFVTQRIGDTNSPHTIERSDAVTEQLVGVATVAATVGKYLWIQTVGKYASANVADAVVAGGMLTATATAGRAGAFAGTEVTASIAQALTDGSGSNLADVYLMSGY